MPETIEVEAKTVQEAIEEAAKKFGVSPEDLEIEVLDTGSGKVLGMIGGKRSARISATLKEGKKEEEQPAQEEADTLEEKWSGGVEPEFEMPKRSYAIEAVGDEGVKSVKGTAEEQVEQPPAVDVEAGGEEIPLAVEEARRVLQDICRFIEPGVEIQIVPAQGHFRLHIPAGGSGIFIGKNGQTLEAIQYVLNRVMSQRGHSELRIVVDSEDYRIRKDSQLRELVKRLADKARRTGKAQFTEPLSAFDRRIVHMALKDEPGVDTYSVGVGDRRKVQIRPTQRRQQGQPRRPRGREGSGEAGTV